MRFALPLSSSCRSGVNAPEPEVIAGAQGGDAAALAYTAMEKAAARGTDVLIIDTAGRLQNRAERWMSWQRSFG